MSLNDFPRLRFSSLYITFTPTHAHVPLPAHVVKMSYIPANPYALAWIRVTTVYGYQTHLLLYILDNIFLHNAVERRKVYIICPLVFYDKIS